MQGKVKIDAELRKLVEFCRKNGVISLKKDGLELQLAPAALFPTSKYQKKKEGADASPSELAPDVDQETLLFWSSAGVPPSALEGN